MAPPSCCEVFDQSGGGRVALGDPGPRADRHGNEGECRAHTRDEDGPARLCQKFPSVEIWVAHKIPPPMSAMPKAMTILAEVFVTNIWERPAKATEVTEAISQARPVFRAEKPSTCCMYNVPMKMKVKKLPPSRNPTAFDPATVLRRNSRIGSRGASTLVSMTRNERSRADAATSMATVWVAAQPTCGAWEIA